uniref:Ig-like domain-containing protein n=2 Tax=Cyprinus carpio TaxID=7962 RepID=A0A9R1SBE9_CYPCA
MIVLFDFAHLKMHLPTCVLMSVLLMIIADGMTVHGPSGPLVAPLGSSVILPCYVDELLPIKGLKVEWRRTDSETLVHLYQDGESRAEKQQQDYQDRAHFFTDQIKDGNFSLRLNNLRAEDEGRYTCTVHSQQDSGETVVQIKDVERLLVSGSSRSISVSVGEDVTLNCSVDSHIPPEHFEEVSWRKTDEDILVLLYQNNNAFPDSSDERYRDRVEFFTAEIPKGNFSLRLKSVRTEDKGVYMCQVFAGDLSANATGVLKQMGLSVSHIMVLIFCITASGSALLLWCLIYCRSQFITDPIATKHVRTLGVLHAFLPNIIMFVAFVLWGVTEGFLYETVSCCALYIQRPLMLIYVAPYLEHMSDLALQSEYFLEIVVYSSVIFSKALGTMVHYDDFDRVMIIITAGVIILLCVIYFIYLLTEKKEMSCHGQISEWIWGKLTVVAAFIAFILPSLHVTLLYIAFGAARGGVFVAIIFPISFFVSFFCLVDLNKGKFCSVLLSKTAWITFTFIMMVVVIDFCIKTMENEKDFAAGWICTTVFQQALWMIAIYNHSNEDLDLTLTFKKILYALGSIGVVLLNAAALMTEMILKTVNGERAVGDLRIVVFSSESIFTLSLLILLMFGCYPHSCLSFPVGLPSPVFVFWIVFVLSSSCECSGLFLVSSIDRLHIHHRLHHQHFSRHRRPSLTIAYILDSIINKLLLIACICLLLFHEPSQYLLIMIVCNCC